MSWRACKTWTVPSQVLNSSIYLRRQSNLIRFLHKHKNVFAYLLIDFEREKIIRIYHENKLLKSKQNEFNEERFHLIQSQFEDERQRSNDLQSKLNETSKLKIELECHLNDLKKKDNENNNYLNTSELQSLKAKEETIIELKSKLARFQAKIDEDTKNSESTLKQLQAEIEANTEL